MLTDFISEGLRVVFEISRVKQMFDNTTQINDSNIEGGILEVDEHTYFGQELKLN